MARTYKTEGIVIKRLNFGEADKLLTIYSKHYGKIKCVAKGIRKLTSRKGGNLELFNQVAIFLAKGKNLDIITEVQIIDSYSTFRKNLKKVAIAYQLCELIDRITREEHANEKLFELLKNTMKNLTITNVDLNNLLLNFKTNMLNYTGFGVPETISHQSLDKHIEKIIEKKVKFFYD
ncbi:DNA repair protein RecO [Patescibacteria group bacterium]